LSEKRGSGREDVGGGGGGDGADEPAVELFEVAGGEHAGALVGGDGEVTGGEVWRAVGVGAGSSRWSTSRRSVSESVGLLVEAPGGAAGGGRRRWNGTG